MMARVWFNHCFGREPDVKKSLLPALVLVALVVQSLAAADRAITVNGPLADYVSAPDASYAWVKRSAGKAGKTEYVELILTSQTWRDIVWKHQLFIVRPSTVAPDTSHALLFITGGNWRDELADPGRPTVLPRETALFAMLAEQVKTPIAVLLHVPQQPIFDGKREDQIIALTFEQFLKTGDPDWPLLVPMVKSAVRGMDAVQQFAAENWSLSLKTFTVAGASKRGWTTWLTGAVDPRATAICPMVIDMLNIEQQTKHQVATWGDYSYKIGDYTQRGLQQQMTTPAGKSLQKIVDPYCYRQWLTQPKLIMLGTNDHYWPLDALNLYWDQLEGDKYILYVPNNGHGLNDLPRILGTLNALHQHAANGKPLPSLSWQFNGGAEQVTLQVQSDKRPSTVGAWVATAPTRDFRQAQWKAVTMTTNGKGHSFDLPLPESGYAALFGEAEYDDGGFPYYLSTNVRIVSPASATSTPAGD